MKRVNVLRRAVADEPALPASHDTEPLIRKDTELLIRNLLREGGFDQRLTILETDFKHLPSKEFVTTAVDQGKKEVKEDMKWLARLLTSVGALVATLIVSLLAVVIKLVFFTP